MAYQLLPGTIGDDYGVVRSGRGRRGRTIPASEWSPQYLGADLIARWDAENAASITQSGGTVSAWADLANGITPVQATGASQPAYSATAFGGRPELTFDGTDDRLSLTGVPALIPTGADECEIWALVRQAALVADTTARVAFGYGGRVEDLSATAMSRQIARAVVSAANRGRAFIGTGAGSVTPTDAAVDFSGVHLIRARVGATATAISIDGGAETSLAAVPATNAVRLRIGASQNTTASTFWNGGINFIGVTRPLSASQAASLQAYLLDRI